MIFSITLGEIILALVSLAAFGGALWVAKSQVAINKKLLDIENFVSVSATISEFSTQEEEKNITDSQLNIYNISKATIYLSEYTLNGARNPNIDALLAPGASSHELPPYCIELPRIIDRHPSDTRHVHISLILNDINDMKYVCLIDADFINDKWKHKITRCTKMM